MSGGAMKRYTSRGVVLSTLKYGDKGMVAHLLTSDRKSTRLNSSHSQPPRMPSSA